MLKEPVNRAFRRTTYTALVAIFSLAVAHTSTAIAQSTPSSNTIVDALKAPEAPPKMRTRGINAQPSTPPPAAKAQEAVAKYTAIKTRGLKSNRGLTMREQEALLEAEREAREAVHVAAKALPQVNLTIFFEYNSDQLLPDGSAAVDKLGTALNNEALKGKSFLIAGHTDGKGEPKYNLDLSRRRAETVKRALIERHGIAPQTLDVIGYGFEHLANTQDRNSAENRRVQVVNVSN